MGDILRERGFFSQFFVDALNPDSSYFSEADSNCDGAVSILEAFVFAMLNDPKGPCGTKWETPWLDDNGDRLPTFQDGEDQGACIGTGIFADQTWLNKTMYSGNVADVNNDCAVDMTDLYLIANHFGGICNPYASGPWDPLLNINYDNLINMLDLYIAAQECGWQK